MSTTEFNGKIPPPQKKRRNLTNTNLQMYEFNPFWAIDVFYDKTSLSFFMCYLWFICDYLIDLVKLISGFVNNNGYSSSTIKILCQINHSQQETYYL